MKRSYKIGEVCKLLDIQPYVLRYWETEFPALHPQKSQSGQRAYSEAEIDVIRRIKRLLYDEGYTIAGAKKRLESESGGRAESKDAGADTNPAIVPIPSAPKPPKVEKPRPPRPPKAAVPAITDASSELPPPEVTQPVDVPAAAPGAPVDDRVPRAVAELKQILALLSRSEP